MIGLVHSLFSVLIEGVVLYSRWTGAIIHVGMESFSSLQVVLSLPRPFYLKQGSFSRAITVEYNMIIASGIAHHHHSFAFSIP